MITAFDELEHLASTLSEEEAAKVLETIRTHLPELYGEDAVAFAPRHEITRSDGKVIRVTIPPKDFG